jgi:hypothetical protein
MKMDAEMAPVGFRNRSAHKVWLDAPYLENTILCIAPLFLGAGFVRIQGWGSMDELHRQ